MRCIYCTEEKRLAEFTREHVVPASFGKFKDAQVLQDSVCASCNKFFGETIDLRLARASLDGLERYRFNSDKAKTAHKFRHDEIELSVAVEGDFKGVPVSLEYSEEFEKVVLKLVPGVQFKEKGTGAFKYVRINEILAGDWSPDEIDRRAGFKIVGVPREAESDVKKALAAKGVTAKSYRPLERPEDLEVPLELEIPFGAEIQRAVAKIAFNYLCYSTGREYVLEGMFDPIRRFIRYGDYPAWDDAPVVLTEGLPFARIYGSPNSSEIVLEERDNQRPVAHFVGVVPSKTKDKLIGLVCFHGLMTHRVILATDFAGVLPEPKAHMYSLKNKTTYGLGARPRHD